MYAMEAGELREQLKTPIDVTAPCRPLQTSVPAGEEIAKEPLTCTLFRMC